VACGTRARRRSTSGENATSHEITAQRRDGNRRWRRRAGGKGGEGEGSTATGGEEWGGEVGGGWGKPPVVDGARPPVGGLSAAADGEVGPGHRWRDGERWHVLCGALSPVGEVWAGRR
jgi:hypothetical protein